MDPLTSAMAVGQIVSLLGLFKQERRGENVTSDGFLEWLDEHGFSEMKDEIAANGDLLSGVEETLSSDHDMLMEKLRAIDDKVAAFSAQIVGVGKVAAAIRPEAVLSDQAKYILCRFVESDSEFMIESAHQGGTTLVMSEGPNIEPEEERLLSDDLDKLTELGLVKSEITSKGNRRLRPTREGLDFVRQMAP